MSPSLPPRQLPTRKFPIIGERDPEPFDPADWKLQFAGAAEAPFSLTFDELSALPRTTWDVDIHCVTRWSRLGTRFRGVSVGPLLDRVAPRSDADLEGVDLRRSNLRTTVGAPRSLAAAQLISGPDADDGARVESLDWSRTSRAGMLEDQELYLQRMGVQLGDA